MMQNTIRIILLFTLYFSAFAAPIPFSDCEKCKYIVDMSRRTPTGNVVACMGSYCDIYDIAADPVFKNETAEYICIGLGFCKEMPLVLDIGPAIIDILIQEQPQDL